MKELSEIPMPCLKCPLLQEKLEQAEKSLRNKTKKRKLLLEDELQGEDSIDRFLELAGIID
jgi:hypothetical protein